MAGAMATGREIAPRPWSTDEYQRKNDLAMALETGDAVVMYDNLDENSPIEGQSFNLAITHPMMATRQLGSNSGEDNLIVPTNALMIATGNHLVVASDMAEGRTLITRVIPDRPLVQRSFLYRYLLDHVLANRPQLVAAALTILRAYVMASDKREPTKFRHREWGDLVAASVAWLGLPDPCLAEHRSKVTDPKREVQEKVVRAWQKAFGDAWLDIQVLIDQDDIGRAIAGWFGMKDRTHLTFKTATPFLRELRGVERLGFKVQHQPGDGKHKAAKWRLAEAHEGSGMHAEFEAMEQVQEDFAGPEEFAETGL